AGRRAALVLPALSLSRQAGGGPVLVRGLGILASLAPAQGLFVGSRLGAGLAFRRRCHAISPGAGGAGGAAMLVDCAASMPAAGRAVGPPRARRLLQLPDTCQQKEKTMIRLLMLAIASVVLLNACN